MPKLSPAFVVTLSAACSTACSPAEPKVAPEPTPPTVALPDPPPPVATAPTVEPTATAEPTATVAPTATETPKPKQGRLNPRTADGRTIMAAYQGDGCFVYLDFPPLRPGEQRVPGTAPPRKNVTCPAEMKDPAFRSCKGGVVEGKGDACQCFVGGNPPRVRPHPCPGS